MESSLKIVLSLVLSCHLTERKRDMKDTGKTRINENKNSYILNKLNTQEALVLP